MLPKRTLLQMYTQCSIVARRAGYIMSVLFAVFIVILSMFEAVIRPRYTAIFERTELVTVTLQEVTVLILIGFIGAFFCRRINKTLTRRMSIRMIDEREKRDASFYFRGESINLTVICMFAALYVFIGSFFSTSLDNLWKQGHGFLPELFNIISAVFISYALIAVIVIIFAKFFIIPMFIRIDNKINQIIKSRFKQYLFYFTLVGMLFFILIFSALFFEDVLKEINNKFFGTLFGTLMLSAVFLAPYLGKILMIIVGFIPLHWIYVLFVIPIKERVRAKKVLN